MVYYHDWKVRQAFKQYPDFLYRRKLVMFMYKCNVISDDRIYYILESLDKEYV